MTRLIGERLVGTVNVNTSLSAGGTSSTTAYSESKRRAMWPTWSSAHSAVTWSKQ